MNFCIKNEFLSLTVASRGAEKTQLISHQGISYLRKADDVWDGVAPLLFPNVGRLKDGITYINNEPYTLPLHGFLKDQEYEPLQIKQQEMTLVQVHSASTLKHYPFKYKAIVQYALHEKTLTTTISIINEDERTMPFNLGGHPGFNCPIYPGESFTDYRILFDKPETFSSPQVSDKGLLDFSQSDFSFKDVKEIPLSYDFFTNDAIIIPRVKSKQVQLLNQSNKGLKFSYPEFISLALWTRPNASFICLEPWIGYADLVDSNQQFIKKDNIVMLEPLATFQASYEVTIID